MNVKDVADTPMKTFFRNKKIFLTGATGSLGQLYLEKLLRCNVKTIYVLCRSKRGKSGLDRLMKLFDGSLYTKLRTTETNFLSRIKFIEGNIRDKNLNISDEDRAELIENCEIVVHVAADVRFDSSLIDACLINTRGTLEMLLLAKEMKNLINFSYISTAYSNCWNSNIEEKFYKCPIDPEDMIKIAEYFEQNSDDADAFRILTDKIIYPWPNTYTLSKALAEELVRRYGETFPALVIRPSIIIATHEDPIPAWCDNVYGLNGMLVACGMGFLRITPAKRDIKSNIICGDFVTNSTLAAIWNTNTEKEISLKDSCDNNDNDDKTKIYHVTGKKDDVTWGNISDTMDSLFFKYPAEGCMWMHRINSTNSSTMEIILPILYHAIPGIILDLYMRCINDKRRFLPMYRKVQHFTKALKFFMTKEFNFVDKNMRGIISRMTKDDKQFFPCDVNEFEWTDYSTKYLWGLRTYIGKEPVDNLVASRKKLIKLKIAHYTVLFFYYLFFAYVYYFLIHFFGLNEYIKSLFLRI